MHREELKVSLHTHFANAHLAQDLQFKKTLVHPTSRGVKEEC
jgi:hypothetical protein